MSVLRALSVLGLVCAVSGFWGGSAHSQTFCESEAVRLAFEHPKVWRQAGSPNVACVPSTRSGMFFNDEGRIELGTEISEASARWGVTPELLPLRWRRTLAHELGHAWAYERGLFARWREWAAIRGLPRHDSHYAIEDYAEVFALWLGEPPLWYAQHAASGAYGFAIARQPTERGMRRLADAGWLPTRSRQPA